MFDENKLREAFMKIKKDIVYIFQELGMIKKEITQLKLHSNRYPTQTQYPTDIPTQDLRNYSLIQQNFHSSIGSVGVPTDSQQTVNSQSNILKRTFDNLDMIRNIKQELKEKFKKLTKQEFLIFSILYTLEEELKAVTYKDIAERAGLAESSIRDYISRLEKKGLPITKEKINNRMIVLKIPKELKEITKIQP